MGRPATKGGLVEVVNEHAGLLEFLMNEEFSGHRDSPRTNTVRIVTANQNLMAPEVEAALVRLATKHVDVLLAHEILGRIQGTCIVARWRPGEQRFRSVPYLAEGVVEWIESIVCSRWCHCVETICFDVVEMITAPGVGNGFACLRTAQHDHRAFHCRPVRGNNCACHSTVTGGGRTNNGLAEKTAGHREAAAARDPENRLANSADK